MAVLLIMVLVVTGMTCILALVLGRLVGGGQRGNMQGGHPQLLAVLGFDWSIWNKGQESRVRNPEYSGASSPGFALEKELETKTKSKESQSEQWKSTTTKVVNAKEWKGPCVMPIRANKKHTCTVN